MQKAKFFVYCLGLVVMLAGGAAGLGAAPPPSEGSEPPTVATADEKPAPDLKALERELGQLRRDTVSSFEEAHKTLEGLQERIARLEKELERLGKGGAPRYRVERPLSEPEFGRIRLVNAYPEVVQVVVNGTRYRLAPGETHVLHRLPAGTFTYEVVGIQSAVERVLRPNETFTVRIYVR